MPLPRQALQLGAKVHWAPAWHKLTSAMRVELSPGHCVSVHVQRDSVVEVEGVPGPLACLGPAPLQSRLRMPREAGRAEVPTLLLNLLKVPE